MAAIDVRVLDAITIELSANRYIAVCVWVDKPPGNSDCRLIAPMTSWLDVKAGAKVLSREERNTKQVWVERTVNAVILYKVSPSVHCGQVVTSGRDWLEGRD